MHTFKKLIVYGNGNTKTENFNCKDGIRQRFIILQKVSCRNLFCDQGDVGAQFLAYNGGRPS